jgi:hypothetical protein
LSLAASEGTQRKTGARLSPDPRSDQVERLANLGEADGGAGNQGGVCVGKGFVFVAIMVMRVFESPHGHHGVTRIQKWPGRRIAGGQTLPLSRKSSVLLSHWTGERSAKRGQIPKRRAGPDAIWKTSPGTQPSIVSPSAGKMVGDHRPPAAQASAMKLINECGGKAL